MLFRQCGRQGSPDPGKLTSDYPLSRDSHEDIISKEMTWSDLYYYHSDNYMEIGFKREYQSRKLI